MINKLGNFPAGGYVQMQLNKYFVEIKGEMALVVSVGRNGCP